MTSRGGGGGVSSRPLKMFDMQVGGGLRASMGNFLHGNHSLQSLPINRRSKQCYLGVFHMMNT